MAVRVAAVAPCGTSIITTWSMEPPARKRQAAGLSTAREGALARQALARVDKARATGNVMRLAGQSRAGLCLVGMAAGHRAAIGPPGPSRAWRLMALPCRAARWPGGGLRAAGDVAPEAVDDCASGSCDEQSKHKVYEQVIHGRLLRAWW